MPALLESIGLPGTRTKRCEELSKGMLQRVQFIAAIMHQPDLLILDEPFSGLDPVSVRLLRERICRSIDGARPMLLSTHVMANAEEMCQHVVMIHQGRKVLDEADGGLRRQFDPRTIRFEPLDPDADPSPLRAVPGVRTRRRREGSFDSHAVRRRRSGGGDGAHRGGGRAGPYRARAAAPRRRVHQHRRRRARPAAPPLARCALICRRRGRRGHSI